MILTCSKKYLSDIVLAISFLKPLNRKTLILFDGVAKALFTRVLKRLVFNEIMRLLIIHAIMNYGKN